MSVTEKMMNSPRNSAKNTAMNKAIPKNSPKSDKMTGAKNETEIQDSNWLLKVLTCFASNGCASVTMMIGNKHLAHVFPFPFLTIILQNSIVFLVCAVYAPIFDSVKPLRRWHFTTCIYVGIATSLVLSTSIVALRYCAVPLIVTFRNTTPVVCALMEYLILGGTFERNAQIGLACGLLGGWIYTLNDLPKSSTTNASFTNTKSTLFSPDVGWLFVIANLVLSAIVMILETLTVAALKHDQPPVVVNCVRIVVMAPILMTFSYFLEDHSQAYDLLDSDWDSSRELLVNPANAVGVIQERIFSPASASGQPKYIIAMLVLTGGFAALFGISGLTIHRLKVRPTTIAFANTFYKLITTLVSYFVFPVVVPVMCWLGYALAFIGFGFYSIGGKSKPGGPSTNRIESKTTESKKEK